ncbi:putative ribonuclease H-like domain-containing protein [Tanacetum coccineum]
MPSGKRAIGTKWVFKNKKDERGIVIKNKARLVAQGHRQEEGIDYEEVFAPMARIEAIRLFLAYASFIGFLVYQMDVKSAFLYETIEEEVYVTQLPRFKDLDHPDKVYKVVKALYGLHQAPRAWYETLANYLLANGFKRGKIDQTLFIKKQKGDILLVQVYVDDIIFGSTNKELCTGFEKLMKDKFQMSSMGELTFFLGLQVQQKEDGIIISQDKYVAEILKKFNYTDVKSASTPVDLEKPLVKDEDVNDVDIHLYRSMIGSLMYITASRPDIMDSPFKLVAYTDSDYVGATQDRKSTTRGCQFLGNRLISWQCKKQIVVATSTTEAEYVAAANYLLIKGFDAGRLQYLVSSSGPRCQDTILRDVNAQTRFEITSEQSNDPPLSRGYTLGSGEDINAVRHMLMLPVKFLLLRFTETHNVVAFLEKPVESDGFAEIIDFLKASSVHYALTVNPIIYTSCIEQFWATAKVHMVNGVRQLQALVDKKRVIITESSIRRDLHLDDAEGTDCLPTATIFEELARMGAKSTAWNEFSCSMASLIICLATNQKFNLSKYIFDAMVKHLDGGVKFLMYLPFEEVGEDSDHPTDSTQVPILNQQSTSFKPKKKQQSKKTQRQEQGVSQDRQSMRKVLDLEKSKDAQAKEIAALKKRIQRLERKKMSGLKRLKKVGLSRRVESSEDQEIDETQERHDDELMFDTGVLDTDEMPVEAKVDEKDEHSTKLDDSTAGEAVTTASIEDSAAPTTIEEITLAQTLIQIKAAKPKVVTTAATTTTTTRPKAKGVVVQEPSEFRVPQEADDAQKHVEDGPNNENVKQERFADDSSTKDVNAIRQHVNTASPDVNTGSLKLNVVGPSVNTASSNE